MLVVENVVLAEAVIPRTAGAIPELEVGIVRIRPSADAALVVIALFPGLFCLLLGGVLELNGLVGIAVSGIAPMAGHCIGNFRPEEDEEVQQCHHRQQCANQVQSERCPQNVHGE